MGKVQLCENPQNACANYRDDSSKFSLRTENHAMCAQGMLRRLVPDRNDLIANHCHAPRMPMLRLSFSRPYAQVRIRH